MKLPANAFSCVGVEDFETKIMVFSLESEHIASSPYLPEEFLDHEELKEKIIAFKRLKNSLKHKIYRESCQINDCERQVFERKLKKYLFELKTHPHLRKHYKKAVALVSKFRTKHIHKIVAVRNTLNGIGAA